MNQQEKLKDIENYVRDLQETMPGFFSHIDQDLKYLRVNKNLSLDQNFSEFDFKGQKVGFQSENPEEDEFVLFCKDIFGNGHITREVTISRNSNKERTYLLSGREVSGGKEAVIFGIDVTDRKSAQALIEEQERKLQVASKLSTVGEMASGIAHEINNPLMVILATSMKMTKQLQKLGIEDEVLLTSIGRLDKTVDRIKKIVDGIRGFCRNGALDDFKWVSFSEIVEETLTYGEAKIKGANVTLRTKLEDSGASIHCRDTEISQVILNLLNNAVDAIGEMDSPKWIELHSFRKNHNLIIHITDCGPGIPKEVRDNILKPFYSTKPKGKGTGIGLSISKNIIEAHDGTLDIDDSCENTRFIITLPARFK